MSRFSIGVRIGAVVALWIAASFAYQVYEVNRPRWRGLDRAQFGLRENLAPPGTDALVGLDWTLVDLPPTGDVPGTGEYGPRSRGGPPGVPKRQDAESVLHGGASSAFAVRVVERMETGAVYELSVAAAPEGPEAPEARIYLARAARNAPTAAPLAALAETRAGPWTRPSADRLDFVRATVRYTAEPDDAGQPLFAHLESAAGAPEAAVNWDSGQIFSFPPIDSKRVRDARLRIIWERGVDSLTTTTVIGVFLSPVIAQLIAFVLLFRTRDRELLPDGAWVRLLLVLALAVAPIQELVAWAGVSTEEWQGYRGPGYWRYVWTSTRALVWLPWGLAASLLIGAAVVVGPGWRRTRLVAGVLVARAAATATFVLPALVLRNESEFLNWGLASLFVLPAAATANDLLFARRLTARAGTDSSVSPGLRAWLFTWLVTLVVQLVHAFGAFSRLSPDRPDGDCFVVTAAAQGHPRVVRSFLDAEGRRVNAQLETLRRLEARIQAGVPGFHRVLRAVYNRVGPIAAARLDRPWRANLAYLMLKPVEWMARAFERKGRAGSDARGSRRRPNG